MDSDASLAVRELAFLQRLARAAASEQDPGQLLSLIIRETTSATNTDVASLYLVSEDGSQLLLTATNGLNERMVGRVRMKVGEGITGWVAQTRRPASVPDVSRDPHWKWVPGLDEERSHSMLSVPIESGPRLVGVVNVQSVEYRHFADADIDFLGAIAGQVAGILERAEMQRRLEVQLAEIKLSHDIHERFTKLSLDGAGIAAILQAVGALAGSRAALYSADGFRVRGAGEFEGMPARVAVPAGFAAGARDVRVHAGRPPRPGDLVRRRAAGSLVLVRANSAVILVPEEAAADLTAVERVAALAQQAAAAVLKPGSVSAGVGNLAASVAELARSHVEARQALRLSRRAGGRSRVTTYRSLGAFRLLLEVQSPEVLRGFVEEVLGSLLRYSESRETPLLPTLEALVAARWVRRAAARALGIHINSMSYRVERIQALSGLSLDDPETRVAIAIALRARAMLGATPA